MNEAILQDIAEIGKERNGKEALRILYTSAYFVPAKNVYLDMFTDLLSHSEEINAMIQLLKQKSLIEPYDKDKAFVIKKRIQNAIRAFLKKNGKEKHILALSILLVTNHLIKDEIHPNYVDHALSFLTNIREFDDLMRLAAGLPSLIVSVLRKQNRIEEALEFGKGALHFLEKALGEGHSATLSLQHNLAGVLQAGGKHVKAEKLCKELREKDAQYSSKKDIMESLIMHARNLCELSKYEEALPLYQTLLNGRTVLETFESSLLVAWNDYGTLLSDMGRHSEAINILEDVIIQKRKVFTSDDQYGIVSRRNLATAFLEQQNYNRAMKYLKDALFEGKERLGKLHPDTLRAERDIGLVLMNKGDYHEALKTLENVEKKFKQVLRDDHLEILCTRANIITTLIHMKKYDEALELSQDVYEAYRNSLGETHNETLRVKNNIGSIFLRQGRLNEAVKVLQEVYIGFRDVFGPAHHLTTDARATLEMLGCLPQTTGSKSKTLHEAVRKGDLSNVIMLVENNADVNEEDFKGRRPLHYAALNGHIGIAVYLLKKGAMYDVKDSMKNTPLELASKSRMKNLLLSIRNLFKNVKKGNHLSAGEQSEFINVKDRNGYNLLHWAVTGKSTDNVQELLDAGCNPKWVSLEGSTALHTAAFKSHVDIAEILLRSVTRKDLSDFINAKTTEKGNTALHVAAENNDVDMVKCLLKYGACYDIPNKEGATPVQLSSSRSVCDLLNMIRKLFSSFRDGDSNVITELKSLGIDNFLIFTKARNSGGLTMLQVAVKNKHRYIGHELAGLLKDLNI